MSNRPIDHDPRRSVSKRSSPEECLTLPCRKGIIWLAVCSKSRKTTQSHWKGKTWHLWFASGLEQFHRVQVGSFRSSLFHDLQLAQSQSSQKVPLKDEAFKKLSEMLFTVTVTFSIVLSCPTIWTLSSIFQRALSLAFKLSLIHGFGKKAYPEVGLNDFFEEATKMVANRWSG